MRYLFVIFSVAFGGSVDDSRNPRFGSIFGNIADKFKPVPMVYVQGTAAANDPATDPCSTNNGARAGGKCYVYYSTLKTYADANTACGAAGLRGLTDGTLWVPDLYDPQLWDWAFKEFNLGFWGASTQDVFLGIQRLGITGKFLGENGRDFSDNPLILSGTGLSNECFVLQFGTGAFTVRGVPCTTLNEYVCEFNISE